MDKEMRPITDAMIATELKPAMRRFVSGYVLRLIGELYNSTYTNINELTSDENARLRAFQLIVLKSDKIKSTLIKVLEEISKRKDELVALLLEKYGMLHGNPNVTYYHDKLSVYFDQEIEKAKSLITKELYFDFYQRTKK
jgi:hypothetical protein